MTPTTDGSMALNSILVLLAAAAAAPGLVGAELPDSHLIDQQAVCTECHDLEGDLGAKVRHAPFVEGDCSTCHNPHVSRFASLLRQQPGPLCRTCHPGVKASTEMTSVHLPFAEGRCADCHRPHGSDFDGLLPTSPGELCSSCHTEVSSWAERRVQHVPFAQARCSSCHEPHASKSEGLLKASGAKVCGSCHSQNDSFRSAHDGFPVERASCQTCHDPHASGRTGLFRETVHPPFEDGACKTCHGGSSDADPFAIVEPEAQLCGKCHQEQVLHSTQAPFPHVSAGGSRCSSCHNPHAGEGSGMLRKEPNATCLTCHDPGGAKSGENRRFATHADDIECSACHAPHGGDRPLLFDRDLDKICGECHTHQHGVSHPMGEDVRDPRTGNPMDCASCHGIHVAGHDKYLHASDKGELCIACHRDIGGRGQ